MANVRLFKKIKLSQGKWALVDVEDFEWLNQWKWYFWKAKHAQTGYAVRNQKGSEISGSRKSIRMHRVILSSAKLVDHINGNGLDNRKANLRSATQSQQRMNRPKFKSSKYKGVTKTQWGNYVYWIARIRKNNETFYLGKFDSPFAAKRAYIKKAKELHGEFARWK